MGLSNNLGKLSNMITSTGSAVGIAQTSPAYTLDVSGTGRFTTGSKIATASGQLLVGSNTSTIGTALEVVGDIYASNKIYGVNGTAANPAIRFFAGASGLYSTTGDDLGISTNGASRLYISSAGNVGIGTSNPASKLDISGGITLSGNGTQANNTLFTLSNGYMYLDGNTNGLILENNSSSSTRIRLEAADNMQFQTASTERMRITSGGDVLIGTTSIIQSAKVMLVFDGSTKNARVTQTTAGGTGSNFDIFVNSASNVCGYIQQNGTTTVNYSNSSDYRLKENVLPIQNAIDRLSKINAVTYTWKDTDNEQGEGFIAHELQEVVPLAVTGEKDAMNQDGTIKAQGIDYAKLTPLLVAAVQEQNQIIQELNERLNKAGL